MGGEAGRAPRGGLRSCACSRTGWGRHHHHHEIAVDTVEQQLESSDTEQDICTVEVDTGDMS